MKCKDIVDLISEFYDDELDLELEKLFEEHIEECNNCLSLFHNFERTIELFHSIEPIKLEPKMKRKFHRWLHIEIKRVNIKYRKYRR